VKNFIPEELINEQLNDAKNISEDKAIKIIERALDCKGLSPEDAAIVLMADSDRVNSKLFEVAEKIKKTIYGNRMVLFAPLYVTNECSNDCLYCGFRCVNTDLKRKTLSKDELAEEIRILEDMGHKRVLLVYGEHPKFGADWIVETINTVYETKTGNSGEIRRVNINSAPMSVEDFKKIKKAGIGTYQCFQETYHLETYKKMHISGKKSDYLYRLYALDRAQEAGIDDVAIGVLFGLYDWKFEVMAILYHALHLEEKYGVGPHTISFPRLEPALGSDVSFHPPYQVSDHDFKRLVAILRLAVPYTGLILTTRETPEMREETFKLGTSQISAGSRTYPGGYHDLKADMPDKQQFTIGDERPLSEVMKDLVEHDYLPSFCTACYRLGRTGMTFMGITKEGHIHEFCSRNALLTFKEYLLDYAPEDTKKAGEAFIERELKRIPKEHAKDLMEKLDAMERKNARDLYY
jgi:2-iminoacetate synthase